MSPSACQQPDTFVDVDQLVTFIRTPTWITAGFAQGKAGPGGKNFAFTKEQKDEFRNDPEKYIKYRKDVENELNRRFKLVRPPLQRTTCSNFLFSYSRTLPNKLRPKPTPSMR